MSEFATLALLEVDCAGLLTPTAALPFVFVGIDVIYVQKKYRQYYNRYGDTLQFISIPTYLTHP